MVPHTMESYLETKGKELEFMRHQTNVRHQEKPQKLDAKSGEFVYSAALFTSYYEVRDVIRRVLKKLINSNRNQN